MKKTLIYGVFVAFCCIPYSLGNATTADKGSLEITLQSTIDPAKPAKPAQFPHGAAPGQTGMQNLSSQQERRRQATLHTLKDKKSKNAKPAITARRVCRKKSPPLKMPPTPSARGVTGRTNRNWSNARSVIKNNSHYVPYPRKQKRLSPLRGQPSLLPIPLRNRQGYQ